MCLEGLVTVFFDMIGLLLDNAVFAYLQVCQQQNIYYLYLFMLLVCQVGLVTVIYEIKGLLLGNTVLTGPDMFTGVEYLLKHKSHKYHSNYFKGNQT